MSNFFKKAALRAAAGVTALAMCMSLSGCYSQDKTWAAKMGDDTMPIGSYIYYLSSAYSDGAAELDTETKVLGSQIEGQNAEQWIKAKAEDYLRSYYYVVNKSAQLGLELTEDDQASIDSASSSMWQYYGSQFEELGVAESSFKKAYAEYNVKLGKLLAAMYAQGGELELPEDEQREYYTNNYIYYQYFIVDLTKTDDEGNSVDMEDDEKQEVKDKLEDYVKKISSGEQAIDTAAANYANASGTEPNVGEPVAMKTENMSELFMNALKDAKNGDAALIDATTRYYVVQRLDVEEDFENLLIDESRSQSLLQEMKGEEFVEYTMEQGKSLDLELNQKGMGSVSLSKVAKAMGETGTVSEDEASSSSSEDASGSDESSEEESSEESEE